jgi:hypothetical protein
MRYLNSPVSPVKIDIVSKNYNSGTRTLDVNLNATALENLTGQYKINYVITEDNLVYNQSGNSYCTGGSSYVHKWVARNMVNTATGENVNTGGTWTNGQVINKTFSTTLGAGWLEANCKLIIFVYKDASPIYTAEIQQSIQTGITMTGINGQPEVPVSFELGQNYPNPFNPVTMIRFGLPKAGVVSLKVYDILGREVANLMNEFKSAGEYIVDFDASSLTSGVYFYSLETQSYKDVKRMVVLK